MSGGAELRAELEAVRKGRGVQEPQVRIRLGPILRRLCGVGENTPPSQARRALVTYLVGAADELPDELRLATRVMFAIEEDFQHRFLRQRYDALAARWNCDFRTVQRRCDEALLLITDQLRNQVVPARSSTAEVFDINAWYIERLSTVLLLDRQHPEAFEERTIVATADGLQGIGVAFGLPRHPAETQTQLDVDLNILYGARAVSLRRLDGNLFVQNLVLPRPLRHNDRHTYARYIRVPERQLMTPRYVHLAVHRCDFFELRVKFAPQHGPRLVWVISKVPEIVYSQHRPGRMLLTPDPLGEVTVRFTDLQPGFGYGLAWLPADGV